MSLIDRVSAKQNVAQKQRPQREVEPSDSLAESAELERFQDDDMRNVSGNAASAQSPQKPRARSGQSGLMGRVVDTGPQRKSNLSAPVARRSQPMDSSKRQSREFELDFDRLNKFGFITPKMRRSRLSEEFRLIKRRLMQRMSLTRGESKRQRGREHVILLTSARPSEGKSFVAVNLALSIILDEGLNVMLVDGDVARPSISKIFGLRNDLPGLTDLLLGDAHNLPDVLLREKSRPLSVLAAGAVVPSATDLFSSESMHNLVNDMASRYSDRIIIFDAPPLLASTEPVALAEHAGQIVMAIDAQRTTRAAVDSALDLLDSDQNVNLVLNKTSVGTRTEQFGSYYEAYNQSAS